MLLFLFLFPLVGIVATMLMPTAAARQIGLLSTVANLAATLALLVCFDPQGGFQFNLDQAWIEGSGLHFHIGIDGIGMLLLLLTNLLAPIIALSCWKHSLMNEKRFYGLFLFMILALNGVFIARDAMLFYIFYELALIPIYFICATWGSHDRIRITLKFFIYTFTGSLFMLVSLLYLYLQTNVQGGHSFLWEDLLAVQLGPGQATWVLLGFFLAFAVKIPVFPFHTWQPDTYTSAPVGGTMLLAGIMLKMGLYGALRFMIPLAPEASHQLLALFMALAITGIVYASIIAVKQGDLKRLIAYSSIAHVGLIAAGIFAWNKSGLQGGMIQMLNHGINVVGLFYAADLIERRIGSRSLSDMGGIARVAPRFAALFMIVVLGSVAVPLTNGFVGEFLLLNGIWTYNNWMGALAGLTIVFGAVYMLRAYGLALFGPLNANTQNFRDLDTQEQLVMGFIAFLVFALGFFPQPILQITDYSVGQILSAVQL